MNQGLTIWLTGLPGSGKTTVARILQAELMKRGRKVELLDGDEIRRGLSADLGFSKADREAHNRRVIYVAKVLARNDVVALVSLISPYRATRSYARQEVGRFFEVYVKCSLATCIQRDPKGLYKKALSGEIHDMTGIQDPYEEPENPELTIETEQLSAEEAAEHILNSIEKAGLL